MKDAIVIAALVWTLVAILLMLAGILMVGGSISGMGDMQTGFLVGMVGMGMLLPVTVYTNIERPEQPAEQKQSISKQRLKGPFVN